MNVHNGCNNKFHHVCAGEHDVDNYVCYTYSILQEEIKHRAMVVEKDDEVANCVIVQSKKKVHAQRKRRSEVLCGTPGCNGFHGIQCNVMVMLLPQEKEEHGKAPITTHLYISSRKSHANSK